MPDDPSPDAHASLLGRRAALARIAALLGGTLSAGTVAGVLAGCGETPPARPAGTAAPAAPAYRLQALTGEQDRMVAAIAEQIIPETGTPGARTARVNEFIDRMLAEYHPAEVRERVWSGLARLDRRARRRHGRAFADCTPEQQYAMVDALDAQAFADGAPVDGAVRGGGSEDAPGVAAQRRPVTRNPRELAGHAYTAAAGAPSGAADSAAAAADDGPDPADAGPHAFFRTLKELTVVGYYTSQAGATRELRVNPHGRWRADVPYAELGAGWA